MTTAGEALPWGELLDLSFDLVINALIAGILLGGLGSLPGTVIGAMLLGILESFTATFYGPSWAPAVAFGVLLLTLAVRPAGLLGR